MSAPRIFLNWAISTTLGRTVELQSIFFATVFFVVLLVLAYLTNPSESSFRAFLTEQSFRQHLSRLDDSQDDELESGEDHFQYPRRPTPSRTASFSGGSAFHFANRAAVSMRTPRHVFRRFGIFTIAAVIPVPSTSSLADSWYLGAFGKWWKAGHVESWWRTVIGKIEEAERTTAGILDMKSLDRFEGYDGLPPVVTTPRSRGPNNSSPKIRVRETRNRNGSPSVPTPSPPSLPMSASLPLITTRLPGHLSPDVVRHSKATPGHTLQAVLQPHVPSSPAEVQLLTPAPSRSPSHQFDTSPVIAEILRQISQSAAGVRELRAQLDDFNASAARAHNELEQTVESHRESKRLEDAGRLELRTKLKTLEDQKRGAEGTRRDAEKKQRAGEATRDGTKRRIEQMGKEMVTMRQTVEENLGLVQESKAETRKVEQELNEELETQRKEIRVVEDDLTALQTMVRELEEKITEEKERLHRAHEQAEIRKQDRSFQTLHIVHPPTEPDHWTPINYEDSGNALHGSSTTVPAFSTGASDSLPDTVSPVLAEEAIQSRRDSVSSGCSVHITSPKPRRLSLTGISNFDRLSDANLPSLRSKGYSIFDNDLAALRHVPMSFSPFDGPDVSPRVANGGGGLIPKSLISTIDGVPGSDLTQDRGNGHASTPLDGSPAMDNSSSEEYDPFEVRPRPDLQRTVRAQSDPPVPGDSATAANGKNRRLNPDAKVFSLPTRIGSLFTSSIVRGSNGPATNTSSSTASSTAIATPNSVVFGPDPLALPLSSSSHFFSPMRSAFAPSPAEREVLQRALGGSKNASLEFLPGPLLSSNGFHGSNGSGVSMTEHSLPSSPGLGFASPITFAKEPSTAPFSSLSWLQSIPSIKPRFSPWDDDEDTLDKASATM